MLPIATLRTSLIDAVEALEEGDIGQYGVVLAIIGQCSPNSIELTEVMDILHEMEVTPEKLWSWFGRYIPFVTSGHIQLSQIVK